MDPSRVAVKIATMVGLTDTRALPASTERRRRRLRTPAFRDVSSRPTVAAINVVAAFARRRRVRRTRAMWSVSVKASSCLVIVVVVAIGITGKTLSRREMQ